LTTVIHVEGASHPPEPWASASESEAAIVAASSRRLVMLRRGGCHTAPATSYDGSHTHDSTRAVTVIVRVCGCVAELLAEQQQVGEHGFRAVWGAAVAVTFSLAEWWK
jgi:D-aminopeptidase